jgi:RNase P subunit RPR2
MLNSTFPAYQSAGIAARWGCFSCLSPLNPAKTQDMGYPQGRGQFAIQCDKCSLHTFFDLLIEAGKN